MLEASFSNRVQCWIEKGFLLNDIKPRIAFRFYLLMQSSIITSATSISNIPSPIDGASRACHWPGRVASKCGP